MQHPKKANKRLCLTKGKGASPKMSREERAPLCLHVTPRPCLGLAFRLAGGSLARKLR